MRKIMRTTVATVAAAVIAPVVAYAEPMELTATQMELITAAARPPVINVNVNVAIVTQINNAVALAFAIGPGASAVNFVMQINASVIKQIASQRRRGELAAWRSAALRNDCWSQETTGPLPGRSAGSGPVQETDREESAVFVDRSERWCGFARTGVSDRGGGGQPIEPWRQRQHGRGQRQCRRRRQRQRRRCQRQRGPRRRQRQRRRIPASARTRVAPASAPVIPASARTRAAPASAPAMPASARTGAAPASAPAMPASAQTRGGASVSAGNASVSANQGGASISAAGDSGIGGSANTGSGGQATGAGRPVGDRSYPSLGAWFADLRSLFGGRSKGSDDMKTTTTHFSSTQTTETSGSGRTQSESGGTGELGYGDSYRRRLRQF